MTLGERIKQVRNFLGYTQQDLADLTGISRISISNYERNSRVPDSNSLKEIAVAKDEDFPLQEYLASKGYEITPSIFTFPSNDIGTPLYTQHLNDWRNPKKQYYILSKGNESFSVPPEAISELQNNIYRAIEFEWYKLKEKYKGFHPPTTE